MINNIIRKLFRLLYVCVGDWKDRSSRLFLRANAVSRTSCDVKKRSQGKTPWVDQACADCPDFPVLGAGGARPPKLHPEVTRTSDCAPELAFAFMVHSSTFLDLLPPAPLPPMQKREAQHKSLQHKGAHTEHPDSEDRFQPNFISKWEINSNHTHV